MTPRADVGPESPALSDRVVKAGTLQVASSLSTQAIAFAGFLVIARLAPPSVFGEYAAASVLLGWTMLLTVAGMQAAVVQRADRIDEAASTALAVNVVGGLLLGLVAAAAGPLVGLFFHSSRVGLAAVVLAGTVPIVALSIVPAALLQRRLAYRQALIGPLPALVYAVSAAVLLAAGLEVWALVAATYLSASARTTVAWGLAAWRPSFRLVSRAMYRELRRYGRPVFVSEVLRESGRSGSIAVVGRLLGTTQLGQFRYAQQLVNQAVLPIVFGSAHVLLPALSRIRAEEERFAAGVLRALRLLSLVVFPVTLGFAALGEPLAIILFGEDWKGAGPIIAGLAGVGVALVVNSVAEEAFKALGRPWMLPPMHALSATVPIALLVVLAPRGGLASGLAVSLGLLCVATYALVALGSATSVRFHGLLSAMAPALVGAVASTCTMALLEGRLDAAAGGLRGLLLLMLEIGAGAFVYLLLLRVLFRRSWDEIRGVLSVLRAGRRRRGRPGA